METAYVLVVRDPDASNAITTDGEVCVIDIDLGFSFDGTPESPEQAVEWVTSSLGELDGVPTDTSVFRAAIETLSRTVDQYASAYALIEEYQRKREA